MWHVGPKGGRQGLAEWSHGSRQAAGIALRTGLLPQGGRQGIDPSAMDSR